MNDIAAPFPGLRPFEQREGAIFFGRHIEISAMLGRLESQRLLTVIGSSGCGKSSLVRAGLLPALEEGFLFGGASSWRFAIFRPGDRPHRKLALALCEALPELQSTVVGETADFVEAALLSGEHSLLKLISNLHLNSGTCLLVLVDQFEELFRCRVGTYSQTRDGIEVNHSSYEARTEATSFVDLLLRTVERQNEEIALPSAQESDASSNINWQCPIFVVLTMRSEFIGQCDMFLGLPEAITASQFLTPRMTRVQMRLAIERPLRLFSSVAHPGLVNRILNDVGPDPDSLPLMQHCLLRTWQTAVKCRPGTPPARAHRIELTIADYDAAGTFTDALEKHADEAYFELNSDPRNGKRLQRVAELLFRLLSRQTSEGLVVRNPVTVREVVAIAQVSADDVILIAKVFAQEGRNFITISPADREPYLDSVLDISHESLFRNWGRLQNWVKAEADSVEDFRWVMQAAKRWENRGGLFTGPNIRHALASRVLYPVERWQKRGGFFMGSGFVSRILQATKHWANRGSLFAGPNLRYAIAWEQQEKPSRTWCARYGGDFELMKRFLRRSLLIDRTRGFLLLIAVSAVLVSLLLPLIHHKAESLKTEAAAAGVSKEFYRIASDYLLNANDPRRNVLSLSTASQAIALDNANLGAVKLACNLMLGKAWCPPLTQPIHYPSTDFLTATLVREDNQNHIFAVSSDGYLLRFDGIDTKPSTMIALLESEDGFHPRFMAASFSHTADQLITIQNSPSPGSVEARLWSRQGLTYTQENKFYIPDYSPFNTLTWSGDDKLFLFLPVRFDQPSICRAFRLAGNAETPIAHPFGDLPLTRVTFSATDLVATLTGETLRLWRWTGDSFQPANSTWKDGLSFADHFHPFSVTFGPGPQHLTVTGPDPTGGSFIRLTIVSIGDKSLENLPPPNSRTGFLQPTFQSNSSNLAAVSIYRAVIIGDIHALNLETPVVQPICFQGTFATAVFSKDGEELLTLSGDNWPNFNFIQLWDVSLRRKPVLDWNLDPQGNSAPEWLWQLARSVSGGVGPTNSGSAAFSTMSQVWHKFEDVKIGSSYYQAVWRHFFAEP